MSTPAEWTLAVLAVAAIYASVGWAMGPRRLQDPILWIGASMAGVLLAGGLFGPAVGERADIWEALAGVALGAWAWKRWSSIRPSAHGSSTSG